VVVGEVPAAVRLGFAGLAHDAVAGYAFAGAVGVDDQDPVAARPGDDPFPAGVGGQPPLLVPSGGRAALGSGVEVGLLTAGEVEVLTRVGHCFLSAGDGFGARPAGTGWDRLELRDTVKAPADLPVFEFSAAGHGLAAAGALRPPPVLVDPPGDV